MLPLETPLNALKQNAATVPNAASDRKYKRVDRAAAYSLPDRCLIAAYSFLVKRYMLSESF